MPYLEWLKSRIINPPHIFPSVSLNANPRTILVAPRNVVIEERFIPRKPVSIYPKII